LPLYVVIFLYFFKMSLPVHWQKCRKTSAIFWQLPAFSLIPSFFSLSSAGKKRISSLFFSTSATGKHHLIHHKDES